MNVKEENILVVDTLNHRVQKFTDDGKFIFEFGRSGDGNAEFNRSAGVAVDVDVDIYVADSQNDRVQLFNA